MSDQRAGAPDPIEDDRMSQGIRDSIKGKAKTAKGKVEDAAGGLTGNIKLQAKGKLDQAKGKAQDLLGRAERMSDDEP
jgi:uncharacterized protein YjbJ (UPF0337 family)